MAIRDFLLRNGFAHRLNKDGTADSICLFCYATVASLTDESELSGAEAIHTCWQATTERGIKRRNEPMRHKAVGGLSVPPMLIESIG
jgi:hypothetical protein